MEAIKREFFEQVRLDGKKYYYASVTFKVGSLFFGLIPLFRTMYLTQGSKYNTYFLSNYKENSFPIDSLESAKLVLEREIESQIKDYKRQQIVSHTKIE